MCKYFNLYQWKTCYVKSSTFSSGGHFVQRNMTGLAIMVKGIMRKICVKLC